MGIGPIYRTVGYFEIYFNHLFLEYEDE